MNIIEYVAKNGYYHTLEKLAEVPLTTPQPQPEGSELMNSFKKVYSSYKSIPTKQVSGGAPLSPPTPGIQPSPGATVMPKPAPSATPSFPKRKLYDTSITY